MTPSISSIQPSNPLPPPQLIGLTSPVSAKSEGKGALLQSATRTGHPSQTFGSRPELLHPNQAFNQYELIQAIEETHSHKDSLLGSFTLSLSQGTKRLTQLSLENMEKLNQAAKNAQSNSSWQTLAKISECILAAFNAVFGVSLIAGGTLLIGGIMVLSSLFTLIKLAIQETGSWNFLAQQMAGSREQQERIEHYLPIAVNVIDKVLSLGGAAAFTMWNRMSDAQQAMVVFQTALTLYQGVIRTGQSISEAKMQFAAADLHIFQNLIYREEVQQEHTASVITHISSILKSCEEAAQKIIELAANALKQTTLHA